MKTLKESLLGDIDTTLQNIDNHFVERKKEMKEFLKAISTAKNYEGFGFKNGRQTRFFVPNALTELGYDANHIEIMMYTMDNFNYADNNEDWKLNIWLSKRSDDDKEHIRTVYEKCVYMDYYTFNKWNEVVKKLIKPAAKTPESFKKLLDNMERWDQQLVSPSLLLK